MKAWQVSSPLQFEGRMRIVFAETASKARAKAVGCDEFDGIEFFDVKAHRAKQFDGRENDPPTLEELVMKHGWCAECRCGAYAHGDSSPEWRNGAVVKCDECRTKCENCRCIVPDDQYACDACMATFDGDRYHRDLDGDAP